MRLQGLAPRQSPSLTTSAKAMPRARCSHGVSRLIRAFRQPDLLQSSPTSESPMSFSRLRLPRPSHVGTRLTRPLALRSLSTRQRLPVLSNRSYPLEVSDLIRLLRSLDFQPPLAHFFASGPSARHRALGIPLRVGRASYRSPLSSQCRSRFVSQPVSEIGRAHV